MNVLVLGAGKMVRGVLTGLRNVDIDLSHWCIYSPSGVSAKKLAEKVGAKWVQSIDEVSSVDWIMVGCKPQQLHDLKQIIGNKFSGSLFISLLAAISERDQLKTLNAKSLIRMMPNMPVEFNSGIVLLSSESAKERLEKFRDIFSSLGEVILVKDDELDELTLLTGSGPAFFYEFALSLARSFTSLNSLERERLASLVLKGSGLSIHPGSNLNNMIDSVTSKGGVTKAVLDYWKSCDFEDVISKGINSGKKRSQEIRDSLQN